MTDLIRARHTVSGVIAEVPESIFNHDVLGAYLEEVGPDAKPYLPEMHRVSLPNDPTDDEIAVAVAAGVLTDDEAGAIVRARVVNADKKSVDSKSADDDKDKS